MICISFKADEQLKKCWKASYISSNPKNQSVILVLWRNRWKNKKRCRWDLNPQSWNLGNHFIRNNGSDMKWYALTVRPQHLAYYFDIKKIGIFGTMLKINSLSKGKVNIKIASSLINVLPKMLKIFFNSKDKRIAYSQIKKTEHESKLPNSNKIKRWYFPKVVIYNWKIKLSAEN